MKWKISLFIAIVVGALAGSWIKNLPGFVIVAYDKTTYEMRLWIAVSLILLALSLLFLVGLFFRTLFSSATKMKGWHGGRNWRISRKKTIEGMLAFTEGRWKNSEDAMVHAAKFSDTKLINYLIAAQAAQQQNAEVRRDAYLRLAHQAEPAANVAIGLTQAQLQLQQGQFEQALASLSQLRTQNPSHPFVLKLLCRLFEKLNDWDKLLELLPNLKKQKVFDTEEITKIEDNCVEGLLTREANKDCVEPLKDAWLTLPAALRKSKHNILSYCRLLIEFEEMNEADNLLKALLKKHVDAQVLAMYGNVKTNNPAKQLNFLENFQQTHQSLPREIYLTLGKLAFYAELWGKARQYLEQALQQKPSAETYLAMAKTLAKLDQEHRSEDCYRQGLEFVAQPKKRLELMTLPIGTDDLVKADLLPQFQKLES